MARFKHPGLKGKAEMSPEKKEEAAEYLIKVHADLKAFTSAISIAKHDHYIFDDIKSEIGKAYQELTSKEPPWWAPRHTNTGCVLKPTE